MYLYMRFSFHYDNLRVCAENFNNSNMHISGVVSNIDCNFICTYFAFSLLISFGYSNGYEFLSGK